MAKYRSKTIIFLALTLALFACEENKEERKEKTISITQKQMLTIYEHGWLKGANRALTGKYSDSSWSGDSTVISNIYFSK